MELIASENYVSPRVLAALGSALTNKYADGYPGRRQYSGCEFVDIAETLAIERARELFDASYANVQPYSGSQANAAVYQALLKPGDTLLGMDPGHGGHITHGAPQSFSGTHYRVVHYGVDPVSGEVDYDLASELATKCRPKMIVAGFSVYAGVLDWQRFREIADRVDAYLMVDMAHVAGLVAAGLYPNPMSTADVVTTTTHKTLRGPRGGMILTGQRKDLGSRLDAGVYPGIQGGPLMHVVAAKAVAFKEALEPDFKRYQQRVLANAKRIAEVLIERGHTVWSGGTKNHMVMLDLAPLQIRAEVAERALERAHLAVNAIRMPGRSGAEAAGLRIGTPAITTRGIDEPEAAQLAHWVADVLEAVESDEVVARTRARVEALCRQFPVYA